jgi:hypothetical protein
MNKLRSAWVLGGEHNITFGVKIEAWTQMTETWTNGRIGVVDKEEMEYKVFLSLVHMECCVGKNNMLLQEEIHLKSLLIQR